MLFGSRLLALTTLAASVFAAPNDGSKSVRPAADAFACGAPASVDAAVEKAIAPKVAEVNERMAFRKSDGSANLVTKTVQGESPSSPSPFSPPSLLLAIVELGARSFRSLLTFPFHHSLLAQDCEGHFRRRRKRPDICHHPADHRPQQRLWRFGLQLCPRRHRHHHQRRLVQLGRT